MRTRGGERCRRRGARTTFPARPLHSTHPSPFAGRFDSDRPARVSEDRTLSNTIDRSHFAGPTRARSCVLFEEDLPRESLESVAPRERGTTSLLSFYNS